MSVQNWSPASQLRLRLVDCGHTAQAHTIPADYRQKVICPVCGREQYLARARAAYRDWTPSRQLNWDAAKLVHSRQLRPRKSQLDPLPGLKELLAEASSGHGAFFDLHGHTLHQGATSRSTTVFRDQDAESFIVWRAAPKGCIIAGGSIVLPRSSVLLLSGPGVHFRHVSFSGGGIVCAGSHFSGSFHRCTFHKCPLSIAHGASATFRRCTLTSATTALSASGPGTFATLHACTIAQCPLGVVAEAGAAVSMASCHLSHFTTAIAANGPSSHLSASSCAVQGGCLWGTTGAVMHGGALRMHGCTIAGVAVGLLGTGSAAACAEVQRCHIDNCPMLGELSGHVWCMLRCVDARAHKWSRVDEDERPPSFLLRPRSASQCARAQMERCTVLGEPDDRTTAAVAASQGCEVALSLCQIEDHGTAALAADRSTRVTLAHCTAAGVATGALCSEHASVRIRGGSIVADGSACTVMQSGGLRADGVLLESRGLAEKAIVVVLAGFGTVLCLARCTVQGPVHGVHQVQATVTVSDTTVVRQLRPDGSARLAAGGPGAPAMEGAAVSGYGGEMTVQRSVVDHWDVGIRVEPANPDTDSVAVRGTATVAGVRFAGCGRAVHVQHDCSAEVVDCEVVGLARPRGGKGPHAYAVDFVDARSGSVRNCTFRDNPGGVQMRLREQGEVAGCTFAGPRWGEPTHEQTHGILLDATGSCVVQDCTFEDVECGIFVGNVSAGDHAVRRCRFSSGIGTGVDVSGPAAVSVSNSTFAKCTAGLRVDEGGSLTAQDCGSVGCCVGVTVGEGAVEAALLRCTFSGSECKRGVSVETGRDTTPDTAVDVDGCVFTDVCMGVSLSGAAVAASLRGCQFSGCRQALWALAVPSVYVTDVDVRECEVGISVGTPALRQAACMLCHAVRMHESVAVPGVDAVPAAHLDAVCLHPHMLTRAHLRGVRLQRCQEAGLIVHPHGRVDAVDVVATDCGGAIHVEYTAERSTFRGCAVRESRPAVRESLMRMPAYQGRRLGTGGLAAPEGIPGVVVEGGKWWEMRPC